MVTSKRDDRWNVIGHPDDDQDDELDWRDVWDCGSLFGYADPTDWGQVGERALRGIQHSADHRRGPLAALSGAPLSSDHIRASWRSSSSSQPLVAASWNIAWNSVESIVGTLS